MNVQKIKCDACGAKHESDGPDYHAFSKLTSELGVLFDICRACADRLFGRVPAAGGKG